MEWLWGKDEVGMVEWGGQSGNSRRVANDSSMRIVWSDGGLATVACE